jgi:hypothetical protein
MCVTFSTVAIFVSGPSDYRGNNENCRSIGDLMLLKRGLSQLIPQVAPPSQLQHMGSRPIPVYASGHTRNVTAQQIDFQRVQGAGGWSGTLASGGRDTLGRPEQLSDDIEGQGPPVECPHRPAERQSRLQRKTAVYSRRRQNDGFVGLGPALICHLCSPVRR